MKKIIRNKSYARIVLIIGTLMLALVPAQAFAHDNLGGDELAVASWMLVAAMVTVVIGVIWAIWGARTGQFNNIESSKYTMLDTADDYDGIMAEYDAQLKAAEEAGAQSIANSTKPPATPDATVTLPKSGSRKVTSNT